MWEVFKIFQECGREFCSQGRKSVSCRFSESRSESIRFWRRSALTVFMHHANKTSSGRIHFSSRYTHGHDNPLEPQPVARTTEDVLTCVWPLVGHLTPVHVPVGKSHQVPTVSTNLLHLSSQVRGTTIDTDPLTLCACFSSCSLKSQNKVVWNSPPELTFAFRIRLPFLSRN